MRKNTESQLNFAQEVNLKSIFQKIIGHKWYFILSILLCAGIAMVYLKITSPKYEVSTSVLIDASGSNRVLGQSKYVDGGVSLIEMEKNLYNEIGIIKSFSLIRKTVEDLGFDIAYFRKSLLKKQECYQYFPFEVKIDYSKPQLYGMPFEVKILSENKYQLTAKGSKFWVSNPANGSKRQIERDFNFAKEFNFGENVNHNYFNFKIQRPDYNVDVEDFGEDDLSFEILDLDSVANYYEGTISVDNIDIQASIFKISTEGHLVGKEVDFLKKLTENYILDKLESRNKIASSKEEFIRKQLIDVSDSLAKAEYELENFKKDKRALNLSATANNALGGTSRLQTERAKIQLDIDYFNSLIQTIQNNRNSDEFEIPTAVAIEDKLINDNIIELKRLYSERSRKKFFVTDSNQEMSILNKQIAQSTDLLLNNLKNSIKASEFKLDRINAQISNYSGVIRSLPTRENELLTIERKSTLYENLFNYLSQELAKTGIARAENTSDTRVLDEARMIGTGPVSPNKKLVLALGSIVGFMLPLLYLVLFSTQDVVENKAQIMKNCDIPVIGSIIHHDQKGKGSKSDVSLWKLKESFRDLSTNLRFVNTAKPCVIGITSMMPEEGKTFTAINLGITLAESGKKTLIIDADLRNPSLVNQVSTVEGKGLSDFLKGEISVVDDIVYAHKEVENLKFIPTTVFDGNIHELLSDEKLSSLFESLKSKFDYILLDTPAVGLVSDFLLLTEIIDINLFIIRYNKSKIKYLQDLEALANKYKNKKSFLLFSDVDEKEHKYGYEDKYGRNKEKKLVSKSLSI